MVFTKAVTDFWLEKFPSTDDVLFKDAKTTITIAPSLIKHRLMRLNSIDGYTTIAVAPELASNLQLDKTSVPSTEALWQKLKETNLSLHGADQLYYFPEEEKNRIQDEITPDHVRQLTKDDEALFSEFTAAASAADLDDAFVELDHWVVFGVFEGKTLVTAASMFPWHDSKLADIGVITLASARGKGYARSVVRAMSKHAYQEGYEPQYRCALDNKASAAVARSSGLATFGTWDVLLKPKEQ